MKVLNERMGVFQKKIKNGGRGEIRTHVSLSTKAVFKTAAFNRSATRPWIEDFLF